MTKPDSKLQAYMNLIDGVVGLRPSVIAECVRQGVWNRSPKPPPDQARFNQVLASLSGPQREAMTEIVQMAADGSVHDMLVFMTDRGFGFTHQGQSLPEFPFDTETYYDYVARIAETPWPDQKGPELQPPPHRSKKKKAPSRRKGKPSK